MIEGIWGALFIFALAAFTGYEVIARVPVILHTPLMSGSNFIHGIVLVGAMVALGHAETLVGQIIGFVGVLLGAMNAVGGYVVTERMLKCSRRRKRRRNPERGTFHPGGLLPDHSAELFSASAHEFAGDRAQRYPLGGRRDGEAVVVTMLWPDMGNVGLMLTAILVGSFLAWFSGRRVAMTDMPQMVAIYNGMGGGAAAAIAAVELLRGEMANTGLILLSVTGGLIGAIAFSGSMIAFAKLQGLIGGKPITFPAQQTLNLIVLVIAVLLGLSLLDGGANPG